MTNEIMNSNKELINCIDEMDNTIECLKNLIYKDLQYNHGVDVKILDDILHINYNDIDKMPVEKVRFILNKHTYTKETLNNKTDEELYEELKDIKDSSLALLVYEMESIDIKKETSNELMNISAQLSSRESTERRISELEKDLLNTTDPKEKREIENSIFKLKNIITYSFLLERVSKYGEKEIESIMKGFLEPERGEYVLKKYNSKVKRFKLQENNFKHFMNIEETFLDGDYNPFNNLFIFIYIRFIAYASPDDRKDRLYVGSLTNALASLFNHSFNTHEEEVDFINFIKSTLDIFESYRDVCIQNNATYKNHDVRKKYDKDTEKSKVEYAKETCIKFGIDYDESIPIDDMITKINEEKNRCIREQIEDYKLRKDIKENGNTENESSSNTDNVEEYDNTVTSSDNDGVILV